jgi:DNA-binding response OmpR family regulator
MANVLIIDDDTSASAALSKMLQREGHHTYLADNAVAGIQQIRTNHPDLVLLDLNMPHVDGLKMLEAVIEDRTIPSVPIAMLSGTTDPQSFAIARKLGACDFIQKGVPWNQLYARINGLLHAKHLV